jgi:NTE family protein
MADHWRAGYDDALRALEHKEIFERPDPQEGFRAFDFGDNRAADASMSQQPDDRSSSSR